MYKCDQIMENIDKKVRETLGMTYEEYDKLDFDEQQELWKKYRKKNKLEDIAVVITSYGDNSIFAKVKKGEYVMVKSEDIVLTSFTREEEKRRMEDHLDDVLYSKPVAFVKKLKRRIKSKF